MYRKGLKKELPRTVYTFQPTREIERRVAKLTAERNIDRTSFIKLGLYMACRYLSMNDVRRMPLDEVVATLEASAPKRFPSFSTFAEVKRPALRPRRP